MSTPDRYVAVHKHLGVFLGFDGKGTPWWAVNNPMGYTQATTFTDADAAIDIFQRRLANMPPAEMRLIPVDTGGRESATVLQMSRAGIDDGAFGDMLLHHDFLGGRH